MTCKAVTPPTLGNDVFYDVPMSEYPRRLFVPNESIEAYKAADEWKKWYSITDMPRENTIVGICGQNVFYTLDTESGLLQIEGTGEMTNYSQRSDVPWSGKTIKSVEIADGITSIGSNAFHYNSSLTSVIIPNSVRTIGKYAFRWCTGLTSVTIGNSVTSIGEAAFYNCTGLTSIIIPNSVTTIWDSAFDQCSSLVSVTIPNSVTEIGFGAFTGTPWYKNQPDGLVYAGLVAYRYKGTMPNNTSIEIAEGTVSIAENAFKDCKGLVSVTIPNSVTTIYNYAFSSCTGLTSITIPSSVTSICYQCFSGCNNLTSMTCNAATPPHLANSVFSKSPQSSGTLYVPYSSVDAYKAADQWKNWGTIAAITKNLTDGTEIAVAEDTDCGKITYTRTFNNTNWQALYVPFSMSYDDWKDDFDVAAINMFHQYDDDNDGTFDRMELEIIKVNGGTLYPNHPYLIRAKEAGEKTITPTDATLYQTTTEDFVCMSMNNKYTFKGTYNTIPGSTMMSEGLYAVANGGLKQAGSESASLSPYRWTLKIESREGQVQSPAEVKIAVIGEDDLDDATGIDILTTASKKTNTGIYDLNGRRMTGNLKSGIYITNGKKFFVK